MRMRSPRIAPPLKGLVGSTATMPIVFPCLRYACATWSTSVLLPAPGEPDLLQQPQCASASLGAMDPGADQRDFHVRARRQRAQQQMALEYEPDELPAGVGGMGL